MKAGQPVASRLRTVLLAVVVAMCALWCSTSVAASPAQAASVHQSADGYAYDAVAVAVAVAVAQPSSRVQGTASTDTFSNASGLSLDRANVSAEMIGFAVAEGAGGGSRVVIGKVGDLTADGAIGPGERTLLDQLPDLGSPKANWGQNSGVLRGEMRRGLPIRTSVDPATGELINNTGFLRGERYLLQDRGWSFDPKNTLWLPPGW